MQDTTIRRAFLAISLVPVLTLAACFYDDDVPTSPTSIDARPLVTISGTVANLHRSGAGLLDADFRIDDFTIARVSRHTPVVAGSRTGDTNFLRNRQGVAVTGRRDGGFLDATRVEITRDAP